MAFRKEMFEKYGGFRSDLGRSRESLISNEDVEFGRRLKSAGQRLRYEPTAIVYHSIAEERLSKRYFRVWWFAYGRSQVREEARDRKKNFGYSSLLFQSSQHCLARPSSSSNAVAARSRPT